MHHRSKHISSKTLSISEHSLWPVVGHKLSSVECLKMDLPDCPPGAEGYEDTVTEVPKKIDSEDAAACTKVRVNMFIIDFII